MFKRASIRPVILISIFGVILLSLLGIATNNREQPPKQEVAGIKFNPTYIPQDQFEEVTQAPVKNYYRQQTITATPQPAQQQAPQPVRTYQTTYTNNYQSTPTVNCEVTCYGKKSYYNVTASMCSDFQAQAASTCVESTSQTAVNDSVPTNTPQQPTVNTQACRDAYQQAQISANQLSQGAKEAVLQIAQEELNRCLNGN